MCQNFYFLTPSCCELRLLDKNLGEPQIFSPLHIANFSIITECSSQVPIIYPWSFSLPSLLPLSFSVFLLPLLLPLLPPGLFVILASKSLVHCFVCTPTVACFLSSWVMLGHNYQVNLLSSSFAPFQSFLCTEATVVDLTESAAEPSPAPRP